MMHKTKQVSILSGLLLLMLQWAIYGDYSVRLLESRNDVTTLQFSLNNYSVSSVNYREGSFASVVIGEDAAYTNVKGEPSLPYVSQSVAIPNNRQMTLEIVDVQYKEVAVATIEPAVGPLTRDVNIHDVPRAMGEVYKKDTYYPQEIARLSEPFIVRDVRGVTVHFNAVQYNGSRNVMKVVENVTVRVRPVGEGKVNVLSTRGAKVSPSYENLYHRRFINYSNERSRYEPVADGEKMIVIAPTGLMESIQPFVNWKNEKGIMTTLFEYPGEIGTGKDAIKSFIDKQYKENNITYVLLVGDNEDIPSFPSGTGLSDPTYVFLAGNDCYPEAFIGRFSASTPTDVTTMVEKTIKYEKEPLLDSDHYSKSMGVASNEGSPKDYEWLDDFRGTMMQYGYTHIDQIYQGKAGCTKEAVIAGIKEGRGWINYMGHGSTTAWGTTRFGSRDVPTLQNGDLQPILISIACVNGEYNKTCFAEVFTRTKGSGGVVFLGSSINQAWTPPQHAMREMIEVYLTQEKAISVGGIIYNGEMKMVEKGGGDGTMKTWILFGDPSLMPYTKNPRQLSIEKAEITQRGSIAVTLDAPIQGRVSVYDKQNNVCLGTKMVTKSNSVTIDLAQTPNSDDIVIVATGLNHAPATKKLTTTGIDNNGNTITNKGFTVSTGVSGKIHFNFPSVSLKNVELSVYNYKGTLLLRQNSLASWNIKSTGGTQLASGVYAVVVKGIDKMNRSHTVRKIFTVSR